MKKIFWLTLVVLLFVGIFPTSAQDPLPTEPTPNGIQPVTEADLPMEEDAGKLFMEEHNSALPWNPDAVEGVITTSESFPRVSLVNLPDCTPMPDNAHLDMTGMPAANYLAQPTDSMVRGYYAECPVTNSASWVIYSILNTSLAVNFYGVVEVKDASGALLWPHSWSMTGPGILAYRGSWTGQMTGENVSVSFAAAALQPGCNNGARDWVDQKDLQLGTCTLQVKMDRGCPETPYVFEQMQKDGTWSVVERGKVEKMVRTWSGLTEGQYQVRSFPSKYANLLDTSESYTCSAQTPNGSGMVEGLYGTCFPLLEKKIEEEKPPSCPLAYLSKQYPYPSGSTDYIRMEQNSWGTGSDLSLYYPNQAKVAVRNSNLEVFQPEGLTFGLYRRSDGAKIRDLDNPDLIDCADLGWNTVQYDVKASFTVWNTSHTKSVDCQASFPIKDPPASIQAYKQYLASKNAESK